MPYIARSFGLIWSPFKLIVVPDILGLCWLVLFLDSPSLKFFCSVTLYVVVCSLSSPIFSYQLVILTLQYLKSTVTLYPVGFHNNPVLSVTHRHVYKPAVQALAHRNPAAQVAASAGSLEARSSRWAWATWKCTVLFQMTEVCFPEPTWQSTISELRGSSSGRLHFQGIQCPFWPQ